MGVTSFDCLVVESSEYVYEPCDQQIEWTHSLFSFQWLRFGSFSPIALTATIISRRVSYLCLISSFQKLLLP